MEPGDAYHLGGKTLCLWCAAVQAVELLNDGTWPGMRATKLAERDDAIRILLDFCRAQERESHRAAQERLASIVRIENLTLHAQGYGDCRGEE